MLRGGACRRRFAAQRVVWLGGIITAFNVLESSLLIGRPCGQGMRELAIGRGAHGYVALYRYVAGIDTVPVYLGLLAGALLLLAIGGLWWRESR